jgi:hypothetical protein
MCLFTNFLHDKSATLQDNESVILLEEKSVSFLHDEKCETKAEDLALKQRQKHSKSVLPRL